MDRSNLGRQTKKEFQQYVTPDDGRKFTELYNVQHLTSNTIDPVSKVCITTIQRLYSMLSGEPEFEPENEEASLFEISPDGKVQNDKTDSRPLERKKGISFDKLITSIAAGIRNDDHLTSLAGRLAKMEREIDEKDKKDIEKAADGNSLKVLVNNLLDAVDPDKKFEKAREMFKTETPTDEQIKSAGKELAKIACIPFDNSKLRNLLSDIKNSTDNLQQAI